VDEGDFAHALADDPDAEEAFILLIAFVAQTASPPAQQMSLLEKGLQELLVGCRYLELWPPDVAVRVGLTPPGARLAGRPRRVWGYARARCRCWRCCAPSPTARGCPSRRSPWPPPRRSRTWRSCGRGSEGSSCATPCWPWARPWRRAPSCGARRAGCCACTWGCRRWRRAWWPGRAARRAGARALSWPPRPRAGPSPGSRSSCCSTPCSRPGGSCRSSSAVRGSCSSVAD
jgi:hypothetical protein